MGNCPETWSVEMGIGVRTPISGVILVAIPFKDYQVQWKVVISNFMVKGKQFIIVFLSFILFCESHSIREDGTRGMDDRVVKVVVFLPLV
jgi:hypothetical protein